MLQVKDSGQEKPEGAPQVVRVGGLDVYFTSRTPFGIPLAVRVR